MANVSASNRDPIWSQAEGHQLTTKALCNIVRQHWKSKYGSLPDAASLKFQVLAKVMHAVPPKCWSDIYQTTLMRYPSSRNTAMPNYPPLASKRYAVLAIHLIRAAEGSRFAIIQSDPWCVTNQSLAPLLPCSVHPMAQMSADKIDCGFYLIH
jgi:hypothetical protein